MKTFVALLLLSVCTLSAVDPVESATADKPRLTPNPLGAAEPPATEKFSFADMLPVAWQKRPKLRFNVYTEMTEEGRRRPEPSPAKPLTYFAPAGKYMETGWLVVAGEKPPPWETLRESMQKALAENGYNLVADDGHRPDLLIVFTYGSFSTDFATLAGPDEDLPVTAAELLKYVSKDPFAIQDVLERARFIGGNRVAEELRLRFSSFHIGGSADEKVQEILELTFHTCYFVTATAYDFAGVEKKQKIPLWQTRMSIDAQGVEMREVLKPLIINTGAFLGRETPEAVILSKRIHRDGRVDVGTPTLAPEQPSAPDAKK